MRAWLRGVAVAALLWLWLLWHLHFTWVLEEQYRYGWAVPLLVALLLFSRWRDRPQPDHVRTRSALILQISLLTLLLPVRVIEEANPDWRLLSWIFALTVVAYTLALFYRTGGASWLRHFAFPICFALVAVPWLVQFENVVVQTLTRAVAAAAVEIASWLGLGAYQLGNVIQLRNGFVGVDEACSGVRTLQTALMVSLFLGELLRMPAARRLFLVGIACVWVFVCNVARAAALVAIAGWNGFDALHRAHDMVGTIVMIAGLAGILVAAFLLRHDSSVPSVAASGMPAALRPVEAVASIVWLALIFGGSEMWYRSHERQLIAVPAWRAEWPPDSQPLPIADSTRAILRYDAASSAAWRPAGREWWGFYAHWNAGRTAAQLVRSHSPDICLPAIGRTFEGEGEPVKVAAADRELRFRAYRFAQENKPLFVFVCIQDDKIAPTRPVTWEWSTRGRLEAAWSGRRNLGQRLLELALIGASDSGDAARELSEIVATIVRPAATD